MVTISQTELRDNVSDVLGRAETGEEFTITVAGRPVAQLGTSGFEGGEFGRSLNLFGVYGPQERSGIRGLEAESTLIDLAARLDRRGPEAALNEADKHDVVTLSSMLALLARAPRRYAPSPRA